MSDTPLSLDEMVDAVRGRIAWLEDYRASWARQSYSTRNMSRLVTIDHELSAMRAIEVQLEASRWRDIAEAPKDKMMLGIDPGRMAWPDIYGWTGNTWMPVRCIIKLNESGGSVKYAAPTRFMVLPSPPTTGETA